MNNFDFCSSTYFAFGKGKEKEVGKLVKKFGGSKVLIHYGGGSVVRSGLLDKVKTELTNMNISFIELGGVKPNPILGLVYEGVELCKKENVDFVLAVGGGSVIDSAKAIAAGAVYDGDVWDFYDKGKEVEKSLPLGTILTIAAAGSEGSGGSVITNENGMLKRSSCYDVPVAKFSIMNPELTYTVSKYQTACGAVDIMAHVFERYFTNTEDVEITDRFCEAVLLTMIKEVPVAIENPEDYGARSNIMWAGMVAHNNICGVGRGQDWASHRLEHELSGMYDVAHGAGLAVMFPAWMKYVMNHDVNRFAQFAVRVWGCKMNEENPEETAKEGIAKYEMFLKSIGMPTRFKDIDAKEEDIPAMIQKILLYCSSVGNFVKLEPEDMEKVYKLAL
ncbi:MAG: iron-containing alcohol dehydrogenase [Lachnospiraceae bacterium]|jgi:alcohol dehydrogenase YqhD (iron-dependent ADH family)|nr:iron-containing alcohol dehydrogenase [Lachnospiraceae bacterium]